MSPFLLNLLLAAGWAALLGQFSLGALSSGFVIGYGVLWLARPMLGETAYFKRIFRMVRLTVLFVYEIVVSSVRVVWDIITPTHLSRPGIIALPLDAKSDGEILLTANLISLTPGTLSLDVSPDRKTLYLHAMFVDDPEALRRELKEGMERMVIEAWSG